MNSLSEARLRVKNRHDEAMDLAHLAILLRSRGNKEESDSQFEQALEYELAAIAALEDLAALSARNAGGQPESIEPTYSVLHRSAGTLALDCNQERKAEQIVAKALSRDPPPEIAEELRSLLEQINFRSHLKMKGVTLGLDELQLSLAGQAVGPGIVGLGEVRERVDSWSRLIYRIVERLRNLPFRERGPALRKIQQGYETLISAPRAASFAVTLKLSQPTGQLHLALDTSDIVDEFMDLMELLNNSRIAQVQERIPDQAYLRNFIELAKKIAPDGDRIRQVGFTAVRDGQERFVGMTTPATELPIPPVGESQTVEREPVEVIGTLLFADATSEETNEIRIVDRHGKEHVVAVPKGMMADIVRPMWDSEVKVRGVRKRIGKSLGIELEDIWPIETDQIDDA